MHLRNSYKRFPSSKGVLIIQWNPAVPTPTIQWTALFVPMKTSFLIGQFPIIYFLPMGKCWQKLGQAKRTTQQFLWLLCDAMIKLSNAFHFCSIGNHSVTKCYLLSLSNIHVHQSDTQLLRQSFSHYKSCKLLHQSNIMSVRYTATEAVSQSVSHYM